MDWYHHFSFLMSVNSSNDVANVKAGENKRISRKWLQMAKKCQQTNKGKSGSGFH
jgi:hypothetical protein